MLKYCLFVYTLARVHVCSCKQFVEKSYLGCTNQKLFTHDDVTKTYSPSGVIDLETYINNWILPEIQNDNIHFLRERLLSDNAADIVYSEEYGDDEQEENDTDENCEDENANLPQ